jgi:predicted mannosyl-3-phosphoglycerate phosphatase (HAD superfamily)
MEAIASLSKRSRDRATNIALLAYAKHTGLQIVVAEADGSHNGVQAKGLEVVELAVEVCGGTKTNRSRRSSNEVTMHKAKAPPSPPRVVPSLYARVDLARRGKNNLLFEKT